MGLISFFIYIQPVLAKYVILYIQPVLAKYVIL